MTFFKPKACWKMLKKVTYGTTRNNLFQNKRYCSRHEQVLKMIQGQLVKLSVN